LIKWLVDVDFLSVTYVYAARGRCHPASRQVIQRLARPRGGAGAADARGPSGGDYNGVVVVALHEVQVLEAGHFGRCLAQPSAVLEDAAHDPDEVDLPELHGASVGVHGPVDVEGGVVVRVQRGVHIAVGVRGVAVEHPVRALARLLDGVARELAAREGERLPLLPQRPVGLVVELVLHVVARGVAPLAVLRPCGFPADVVVVGGGELCVLARLRRGLVVRDGEVVDFRGVVFRAGQLVPLGRLHVVAHAHVDDARFEGAADGLLAIHGVGGGVEAVARDAEVGAPEVLDRVVEGYGDVAAVGAQVDELAVAEALGGFPAHLFVGGRAVGLRQGVHELSRGGMQLQDGDVLALCVRARRHADEGGEHKVLLVHHVYIY